MLVAYN